MELFKNYKKLYNEAKSNNKIYVERNCDLYKRDLIRQEEAMKLREEIARLKIELEDTKGFLMQEKRAKEELLIQRNDLKKEIKNLKCKNTKMKKEIDKKGETNE